MLGVAKKFVWLFTSQIWKLINVYLCFWKTEENLQYLCWTWFKLKKIQTRRNVRTLCRATIMHEHLTYFPCKHVPHLLIAFTQRTAWHISHINTSSVPEGEAAPCISTDLLVWEHLETFKEDVCRIKKLLIKYHSSQKTVKLMGFWKASSKIPAAMSPFPAAHTFTVRACGIVVRTVQMVIRCAREKDVEHWGERSEQPITRVGLCHLPARRGDCCLSAQLA